MVKKQRTTVRENRAIEKFAQGPLPPQGYMPGQTPFRGHAIRHIIATDYLKRNPGDYITVAKLLHDELSTVLREYAHLQVDDSLKRLTWHSCKD